MRNTTITTALAIACLSGATHARVIHEDFDDGFGGAAYDAELTFDFGTSTDFTGGGDTNDLFPGVQWMYADLATITVNSLAPGEYIESVEVNWTDFCGTGCTTLEIFGAGSSMQVVNSLIGSPESVALSDFDLGAPIDYFTLSSFEGQFVDIWVTVVPTPSSLALLGFAGIASIRRRR